MKDIYLSDRARNVHRVVELATNFVGGATDGFTATAASGTVAALTDAGGGVSLTTQAADNAAATLVSPAIVVLAAGRPIVFGANVLAAQANTSALNIFIGLCSGTASAVLADNGAGTPASYSGVGFFGVDGDTTMSLEVSVGSTQTTHRLTADVSETGAAVLSGSSSYRLFEIEIHPKTSALADVVFKIDGTVVKKITSWTYTSIADMQFGVVIKAGSTTAEVFQCNACYFAQVFA